MYENLRGHALHLAADAHGLDTSPRCTLDPIKHTLKFISLYASELGVQKYQEKSRSKHNCFDNLHFSIRLQYLFLDQKEMNMWHHLYVKRKSWSQGLWQEFWQGVQKISRKL